MKVLPLPKSSGARRLASPVIQLTFMPKRAMIKVLLILQEERRRVFMKNYGGSSFFFSVVTAASLLTTQGCIATRDWVREQMDPLSGRVSQTESRLSKTETQLGSLDGDRKSTRLNSSHSSISYAVFCLKKKKKYNK